MDQIMTLMDKCQRIWLLFKGELTGTGTSDGKNIFETFAENMKDPNYVITILINIILFVIISYAVLIIHQNVKDTMRLKKLSEDKSKDTKGVSLIEKIPLVNKLKLTLNKRFDQKKWSTDKVDLLVYGILGLNLLIAIGFVVVKQYALAIAGPIILVRFLVVLMESLELDTIDYLHAQLPQGIDSIQKVASRYGDLKTIFFEAAVTLPQPIRGEFENLGRQMNSRNVEEALEDFRNRFDDVWISSFVFVILSMTDTTEKSVALSNLTNLREMLERENRLKQTAVADKKLSVSTNYVMAGMGAFAGIVGCFVETAREFYFSTPAGLLCFIGGYVLIGITIKVNLRMSVLKNQ